MNIKTTKICKKKGCNNEFKLYRTTDKYCSAQCAYADQKRKPIKQAPIKPMSDKLKRELYLYSKKRKKFLLLPENKFCPVIRAVFDGVIDEKYFQPHDITAIRRSRGNFYTDSVHHMSGRRGKFLNYIPYWLAVSDLGHKWIHDNPEKAYELRFLIQNSTVNI